MIKIFTRLFIGLLLLSTAQNLLAQDIHFSQFYSSPLTLNPAMTGNIAEHFRANFTYRNQWASIPAPYSTVAASVDASLLGCQLGVDHVGVGLAIYNDRSGDGTLNDVTALASVAYHKGIDSERKYMLSLGGQVGFTQKSIDITKLFFESQIQAGLQPDLSAPNMEPFQNNNFNYVDFRAGGLFTGAPSPDVNFYLGLGYFHLTKPTETFLDPDLESTADKVLDPRLVVHGGGSFFVNEQFSLSPSALFMSQTGARDVVAGLAAGYHFDQGGSRYRRSRGGSRASADASAIYLGAWYRLQDAVIVNIGVDYQRFKFGFSYDINISDLRTASLGQGALELTLSYSNILTECRRRTPTYCPRF